MAIDLAFVWAMLIAFAVLAYVILDGFDLGIGILFPFLDSREQRDTAMNTVAPVWDGNETWLILGGGGLFAVFPLAYAVLMPALYAPIIVMLLGLIFRGVAFEYRWRTNSSKWVWDWSFTAGSGGAAFAQGIALGALLQGVAVAERAYTGGWWDWLTPFSLVTGSAVVVGYGLLGATWLILKTEGALQNRAYNLAWVTGIATLAMIGIVSLWTPFLDPVFIQRWFDFPAILYTMPVPVLVTVTATSLFVGLMRRRDFQPFLSTIALFVLCFVGLGISLYPHIVPPSITIWDAAAPDSSLLFLLVGALVLIPLILAYTSYSYWVFRGKVRDGEGFH
ncbi:MAG: cytochrome d ubiquinol oxidase subunit II [Hyphomicrobiaceae bacterium]